MQQNKKKKWYRLAFGAGLLILLCCLGIYAAGSINGKQEVPDGPVLCFVRTQDDADCILIRGSENAVLIDTGEAQDADHILEILRQYQVERLDAMILTHPDKDHIGGAGRISREITVEQVIEPYYTLENERLDALHSLFSAQKVPVQTAENMTELSFMDFALTVYPPQEKEYKKDNNYSLAVLFAYQDSHALFTGDAMKKRIQELMEVEWPGVDLLKVPYHGRYTKGEEEFLMQLAPEYAVVTAAEAEPEVQEALSRTGAGIWNTREDDVTFMADGNGFFYLE